MSSQNPLAENRSRSTIRQPAQSAVVAIAPRPITWFSGNIE
jgi:hypothetical protein